MKTITIAQAKDFITNSNGRFFRVDFTKKDGSIRVMVCRTGVKKYVNGIGLKFNPRDFNLLTVFDVTIQQYRMINLNSINKLNINNEQYEVTHEKNITD